MGKRREVVRELQMDLARVIQLQAQAAHVNGEADGWLPWFLQKPLLVSRDMMEAACREVSKLEYIQRSRKTCRIH